MYSKYLKFLILVQYPGFGHIDRVADWLNLQTQFTGLILKKVAKETLAFLPSAVDISKINSQ